MSNIMHWESNHISPVLLDALLVDETYFVLVFSCFLYSKNNILPNFFSFSTNIRVVNLKTFSELYLACQTELETVQEGIKRRRAGDSNVER